MKTKIFITLTVLIIASLLLCGYYSQRDDADNPSLDNENVAQERINLHFGDQGAEDFRREQSGMDMHPVGMGFMDLRWRPPNLGKVRIVTDHSDLEIDHIFKVMGVVFSRPELNGVHAIDISSSLHRENYTTQEAAYNAYIELMTQLNEKGWKQYFLPFSARIDKRDNLKHIRNSSLGEVIDSTYILTFDEWQESDSFYFNLYNHEILLSIMIKRRFQDKETDRELYMVDYSFETQRYFGRNMISGSDKMNAEELEEAFKQNQIEDKKARYYGEIEAREEGYRIDETYIDQEIWQYVK